MASTRSIRLIALDVVSDWKKVNYAAVPYLKSMLTLDTMSDKDMCEDADAVVLRFLGNSSAWRGPVARKIKAELRGMLP